MMARFDGLNVLMAILEIGRVDNPFLTGTYLAREAVHRISNQDRVGPLC